jgi:hypothetical protein
MGKVPTPAGVSAGSTAVAPVSSSKSSRKRPASEAHLPDPEDYSFANDDDDPSPESSGPRVGGEKSVSFFIVACLCVLLLCSRKDCNSRILPRERSDASSPDFLDAVRMNTAVILMVLFLLLHSPAATRMRCKTSLASFRVRSQFFFFFLFFCRECTFVIQHLLTFHSTLPVEGRFKKRVDTRKKQFESELQDCLRKSTESIGSFLQHYDSALYVCQFFSFFLLHDSNTQC